VPQNTSLPCQLSAAFGPNSAKTRPIIHLEVDYFRLNQVRDDLTPLHRVQSA
jgi:hypothetical protein